MIFFSKFVFNFSQLLVYIYIIATLNITVAVYVVYIKDNLQNIQIGKYFHASLIFIIILYILQFISYKFTFALYLHVFIRVNIMRNV